MMAVMAMHNAPAMGHNRLHILTVSVIRLAIRLSCINANMVFLVFADRMKGPRHLAVRIASPVSPYRYRYPV
jgi:hypothetical protein